MIISYPVPNDLITATALQQLSNWMNVPSLFSNTELDVITTNPRSQYYAYQYEGAQFPNTREVVAYGAAQYSNNLLQDCSVQQISITEYVSPNPPYGVYPVILSDSKWLTSRLLSRATILGPPFTSLKCIGPFGTIILLKTSCIQGLLNVTQTNKSCLVGSRQGGMVELPFSIQSGRIRFPP